MPAVTYDPRSRGAVAYTALAQEVFEKNHVRPRRHRSTAAIDDPEVES
jgi:hypothetical protein